MRLRNIPGAREAVAASPFVVQDGKACRGSWQGQFAKEQPLYIEIGMGKGRFIMDQAALHPEINFVGIERYSSVLLRGLEKAEERTAAMEAAPEQVNFRFLCEDAAGLPEIFSEGEVDRIYLNFSDPWPKDRHAKRRLTSRQFLARYDKILKPDGIIEFKTDNQDLFDFTLEEIGACGWQILACTRDLHHDTVMNEGNVMTEYEERFSSQGNPICKVIIRR